MTPPQVSELEVLVLMAILHLAERQAGTNGSAIRAEIETRTGRPVPRGSIYVTLDRLSAKRLLTSTLVTSGPGRRPKRLFAVNAAGMAAVRRSVTTLVNMHRGLEPIVGDT